MLLWVVLLCACFRLWCGAGFSTLLFGAACFLPPYGARCCSLLFLFCGAVFLLLPCGWCCLSSPSFFCGAAFLRLLAVLLPFSSKTELNTANATQDEANVNLLIVYFLINCCSTSVFVYLQLLFFFRFIFLLACWLLGRFMEGIQILSRHSVWPAASAKQTLKVSLSSLPPSTPPHTIHTHTPLHPTPPTHTLHSSPLPLTTPSSLLPDTHHILPSRGRSFFGVIRRTWPARVVSGFQSLILILTFSMSCAISEHILVVSDNMLGLLRTVLKQEPQSPTCVSHVQDSVSVYCLWSCLVVFVLHLCLYLCPSLCLSVFRKFPWGYLALNSLIK